MNTSQMKKAKLIRTEIRFSSADKCWRWSGALDAWPIYCLPGETKRQFIKRVVQKLHELHKETGRGFTLRIRTKAGTWAKGGGGEKTIPASMDPRKSKG
jgi:hypothetical protein